MSVEYSPGYLAANRRMLEKLEASVSPAARRVNRLLSKYFEKSAMSSSSIGLGHLSLKKEITGSSPRYHTNLAKK
jgi:hypothetical protein